MVITRGLLIKNADYVSMQIGFTFFTEGGCMGNYQTLSSSEEVARILEANRELRYIINGCRDEIRIKITKESDENQKSELVMISSMLDDIKQEIEERGIFYRANLSALLK